jgi:hypothetical protein
VCQVVDPSEGDAIHVRMLSASCPSFHPLPIDRANLNIASLFALPEAENYFAAKVIHNSALDVPDRSNLA